MWIYELYTKYEVLKIYNLSSGRLELFRKDKKNKQLLI